MNLLFFKYLEWIRILKSYFGFVNLRLRRERYTESFDGATPEPSKLQIDRGISKANKN